MAKHKALYGLAIGVPVFLILAFFGSGGKYQKEQEQGQNADGTYQVDLNSDIPIYKEIKGNKNIPDEVAQLAVGTAVKYRLLPSVIISQWAFESDWGKSESAKVDHNYFGLTWFDGCKFPKGSARGAGGSEGGNYIRFRDATQAFNFYGYTIATQPNFAKAVGKKEPGEVLLILGKGGYASAGITKNSSYYTNAMDIIQENDLKKYDEFAIKHWHTLVPKKLTGNDKNPKYANEQAASGSAKKGLTALAGKINQTLNNGQCYGLTAYYVDQLGGPKMMGSGHVHADRIGEDYDWEKYGFKVIENPQASDIKPGDILNWQAGGALAPGTFGHTGVVDTIDSNGKLHTFEQNAGKGQTCQRYVRNYSDNKISSLVRKVK